MKKVDLESIKEQKFNYDEAIKSIANLGKLIFLILFVGFILSLINFSYNIPTIIFWAILFSLIITTILIIKRSFDVKRYRLDLKQISILNISQILEIIDDSSKWKEVKDLLWDLELRYSDFRGVGFGFNKISLFSRFLQNIKDTFDFYSSRKFIGKKEKMNLKRFLEKTLQKIIQENFEVKDLQDYLLPREKFSLEKFKNITKNKITHVSLMIVVSIIISLFTIHFHIKEEAVNFILLICAIFGVLYTIYHSFIKDFFKA